MSETESVAAQEVAPPTEAPVITEETVVTEEAPQPLSRTMSRKERVSAIRERITKGAQPDRGPDGRFVPQEEIAAAEQVAQSETEEEEETEDAAAEQVASTVEAATEEQVAEEATPSEETKAEETPASVTIPLDPSHPLYAQGITELPNVPPHLERAMRTMANATVRKQDVEQARAAQQAAETELALTRARMEMLQSGEVPTADSNPEIQTLLKDIENTYPDQLDTVKSALDALQQQTVQAKEAEVMQQVQRQQVGQQFLTEVQSSASKQYPVWSQTGELPERMRTSVAQYGDYVDARNANLVAVGQQEQMPSSQEFFSWVDTNYVKDERVQSQLAEFKKENEARIGNDRAAEAVAAERQKMANAEKLKLTEAATRHGTKPPSPPAMRSQGSVVPATPANEEARQNHGTRQRDLRASIRQRLQQSST